MYALRRLIHVVNQRNPVVSSLSLVLTIAAVVGLFVWAYSEVKSQTWTIGNLGETRFTISFVGFVIALFILFKNALGDIDHLINQRGKVVTFLGSVNNPYP